RADGRNTPSELFPESCACNPAASYFLPITSTESPPESCACQPAVSYFLPNTPSELPQESSAAGRRSNSLARTSAQTPSDHVLPTSQWWQKGSTRRPSRQPYSLLTACTTLPPAVTARWKAASGSSTIITMRTVPPPRDSGLKFKCSG